MCHSVHTIGKILVLPWKLRQKKNILMSMFCCAQAEFMLLVSSHHWIGKNQIEYLFPPLESETGQHLLYDTVTIPVLQKRCTFNIYCLLFINRVTRFVQGNTKPDLFVQTELSRAIHKSEGSVFPSTDRIIRLVNSFYMVSSFFKK